VLVADGLGAGVLADLGVVPGAGVQPARLAGERESPLAEPLFQELVVKAREVADLADAKLVQILLRDLADARNPAHVEWREKIRLQARDNPDDAIGFGLIGADLGHHPRGGDADGAVEIGGLLHAIVQDVSGAEGRPVEALGAGDIEIGFVDRRHFDQRAEGGEDVVNLVRVFAVTVGVAIDEDRLWTELVGRAQRHS
jgi:hypothetical protein